MLIAVFENSPTNCLRSWTSVCIKSTSDMLQHIVVVQVTIYYHATSRRIHPEIRTVFKNCQKYEEFYTSFYIISLCLDYNYSCKQQSALRVQSNITLRIFWRLPRFCSAWGLLAEARVGCSYATTSERCTSLVRRLRASRSNILITIPERLECRY